MGHILAARGLLGRLGHALLHILAQQPVDEDAGRVGMRPVLEDEQRAAADRLEIVVGRIAEGPYIGFDAGLGVGPHQRADRRADADRGCAARHGIDDLELLRHEIDLLVEDQRLERVVAELHAQQIGVRLARAGQGRIVPGDLAFDARIEKQLQPLRCGLVGWDLHRVVPGPGDELRHGEDILPGGVHESVVPAAPKIGVLGRGIDDLGQDRIEDAVMREDDAAGRAGQRHVPQIFPGAALRADAGHELR